MCWRSGRDSNPRYVFTTYNGLANRRLQPLGHRSVKAIQALTTEQNGVKIESGTPLAPANRAPCIRQP
jgi:hypothetical protein